MKNKSTQKKKIVNNTIIIDEKQYYNRTRKYPPKSGEVTASFWIGSMLQIVSAENYQAAVDSVKEFCTRPDTVYTIILEDIQVD